MCSICSMNGVIYEGESQRKAAHRLGVGKTTVARHLKNCHIDEFLKEQNIPEEIVTHRGISRYKDGEWQKVSWDPRKKAIHDALQYDDLERLMRDYKAPAQQKSTSDSAFALFPADLQIGKQSYLGGTPQLIERVMLSYACAEQKVLREKPKQMLFADLGDIIEGFMNVSSQRETNDLDLVSQIRTARMLMAEGIKKFAPLVQELVVASVPSNHCSVRVSPQNAAATIDNDYGLDINDQLRDIFDGREGFEHVSFVKPMSLSASLTVTLADTVMGLTHGDLAKTPVGLDKWWQGQSHGRMDNLHNADMLFSGHFHSLRMEQSGDERWLFVAPTSDNGSDWFSRATGKRSTPGMLGVSVQNGMWLDQKIY